jgi:hypothetical protein
MQKITVFMATVLAIATFLAAGLVVFPGWVQETQANPCSVQANGPGGIAGGQNSDNEDSAADLDTDCDFEGIGELEIAEAPPLVADLTATAELPTQ